MGLIRMERSIKERMNSLEVDAATPQDIINAKPLVASLKEFLEHHNCHSLWIRLTL